jgi:hypothetical protein
MMHRPAMSIFAIAASPVFASFTAKAISSRRFAFFRPLRLRRSTLEVGRWTFSVSLASATPAIFPIAAFMLRIALARRWFVHPRWQHFQIDERVELERSFGHE